MKKLLGVIILLGTAYVLLVQCVVGGIIDVIEFINNKGVGMLIVGIAKIIIVPLFIAPIGIGGGLSLLQDD